MEGGSQSCTSCGSTSFDEIDGLYYCSVCSTQRTGFTLEVRQYDDGIAGLSLLRDVTAEKKRKKKKKDFGQPWTYIEAYNLILNHQCTQLEKNLKLGPKFRAILFALWTEYLEKCELAFTGDKDHQPKINLTSLYRDIQLIGQGMDQITKPLRAAKRRKESVKAGNLIVKRYFSTTIGEDPKATQKESDLISEPGSGDDNDSNSDDGNNNELVTDRFQYEYESHRDRYEDDYGQVDEEIKRLDLACIQGENFDLDDVPIVEWTEEMQDNFLFNYDYNTLAIENFKQVKESTTDKVEVLSKPFSAEATRATTLTDMEAKRVDINGLKPRVYPSGPRSNDLRKIVRGFLQRYDNGEDFESLMEEIDEYNEGLNRKDKKKKKKSIKNVEGNEGEEEEEEEEEDDDRLDGSEKIELTKRSQIIKKLAEGAGLDPKDPKKLCMQTAHFITMEKMTMTRTLQFIYLAFRICGYNVYVGDLFHWVLMGHLTFFDVLNILPDSWYIMSAHDIMSLQPIHIFQTKSIDNYGAQLRRFLSIPDLPFPDFNEILIRHLYDLNLPLQFADIIEQKVDRKLITKIAMGRFRVDKESNILPDFSLVSISSIIVILHKLFNFDGKTDTLISNYVRIQWPDSFIWEDWLNDNRTIWKLMSQHYFPIQPELFKEIPDVEVIRYYRETFTNNWFGRTETRYSTSQYNLTKNFRENYAKTMEDTFEVDPCTVEPPPFTVYHFYEAKKFIARRIKQIRGLSSLSSLPSSSSSPSQSINIFDVDYTNKSIDYLFDKSFTRFQSGKPNVRSRCTDNPRFVDWPESFRLPVKIGLFITHRPLKSLLAVINSLNRAINLDK